MSSPEEQRRNEKRSKAVAELLETERTYVDNLKKLCKYYVRRLRPDKNPNILSPEEYRALFPSDINLILNLQEQFLQSLETLFASFSNETSLVGDEFIQFIPYFKMYQNYLNNHGRASQQLTRLKHTNTNFTQYCETVRSKCGNQPLESLLILPIQRIPRYELHLKEIVKSTNDTHPDYMNLTTALSKVQQVGHKINKRMEEFETREKVKEIEKRFGGDVPLVAPARRLIKEGLLVKMETKDDHDCQFFLFNDVLVYATETMLGSLRLQNKLPLNKAFRVNDVADRPPDLMHCMEVHSTIESFMVYAHTASSKIEWMDVFRETLEKELSKPKHLNDTRDLIAAPMFVPDDLYDECMMTDCNNTWSLMNRRHHCYHCGLLVCHRCSNYRLPSLKKDESSQVVRVCKLCYAENKHRFPGFGVTMSSSGTLLQTITRSKTSLLSGSRSPSPSPRGAQINSSSSSNKNGGAMGLATAAHLMNQFEKRENEENLSGVSTRAILSSSAPGRMEAVLGEDDGDDGMSRVRNRNKKVKKKGGMSASASASSSQNGKNETMEEEKATTPPPPSTSSSQDYKPGRPFRHKRLDSVRKFIYEDVVPQLEAAQHDKQTLIENVKSLRAENAHLNSSVEQLTKQVGMSDFYMSEVKRLEGELLIMRGQLEEEQSKMTVSYEEFEQVRNERDTLSATVVELSARVGSPSETVPRDAFDAVVNEKQLLKGEIARLKKEKAVHLMKMAQLGSEKSHLEERCDELVKRIHGNDEKMTGRRLSRTNSDEKEKSDGPVCERCGEVIVGRPFKSVMNQIFHRSCYVCDECGTSLHGQKSLGFRKNADGSKSSLCHECTDRYIANGEKKEEEKEERGARTSLTDGSREIVGAGGGGKRRRSSGRICTECGERVSGQATRVSDANGKVTEIYHPRCYKCQRCGDPMGNKCYMLPGMDGGQQRCCKKCAKEAMPFLVGDDD